MRNIYQRISDVMKDIEYLTKDDEVSTGKSSYRAVTEEKVTSAVRAAMVKHGIVIVPIEQEHARVDEVVKAWNKYEKREEDKINRITTVNAKYRIQNIDDPQDCIIAASSGTGVDTQDKGVGKAMTYAFKYLLLRTFAIPTGDDPDKVSSDLYTDKLIGATDKAREKFKPNVYGDEFSENTPVEVDTAGEAKAEIIARIPNPALRDVASKKRFGKKFDELGPVEIIEVAVSMREKDNAQP